MSKNSVYLKPVEAKDSDELFPQVFQSPVTDTILWDGPSSLDEYRSGLEVRERQVKEGLIHLFTIVESETGNKIGSIDIRPYEESFRGDMGLWIGLSHHGKGYGTEAVRLILQYGFEKLHMEKIEAKIFTGNHPSRKIFEKNGFQLEGTVRKCAKKRGRFVDEWLFGITKEDFKK